MEVFKMIAYNESVVGAFKSLRIGLPLFSSLVLVYQGIRANIKIVWRTLLWAILISIILSIISIFVYLPIYYNLDNNTNILVQQAGRLINSNASFGIIGLYLLFKDKEKWYNQGKLPFYTSIASIISLILAFNRTYLVLLFVLFVYLAFSTFNWKKAFRLVITPILILGIFALVYQYSEPIRQQVDLRILSIVKGSTTLEESAIENNRDIIYEGIENRIKEGYWIFGLPYEKGVFEKYVPLQGRFVMSQTDTSIINVLLINGLLSLFFLIIILIKLFKIQYIPRALLFVFILASLNIDSLYSHNSILFLFMFGMLYKARIQKYSRLQTQTLKVTEY
jgi:hypothetical protein